MHARHRTGSICFSPPLHQVIDELRATAKFHPYRRSARSSAKKAEAEGEHTVMIIRSAALLMISAIALAACSQENAGAGGQDEGGMISGSAGKGTMPANFKATDACSVIDKAAMASLLNTTVSETSLALVHEPTSSEAATSECAYITADGRASVMLRWSPISDNTEGAMTGARNAIAETVKAMGNIPIEDISGLGKKAFFVTRINQLNVFIGEDKMAIITVPAVAGHDPKEAAVSIARKLGA